MKKYTFLALCVLLLCGMTGCLRETTNISESAGVMREPEEDRRPPTVVDVTPPNETTAGYTPPPLDNPDLPGNTPVAETTPTNEYNPDAPTWEIVNGKYEYNFAPRDKSGQADLSDLATISQAAFPDQPDDWYPGKSTYDETTDTVTYGWDRYAETLEILAETHGIYRGDTSRKVIYLTFDCGYEYGPTEDILDILKEKQAPGIFFLTGQYMREETALITRMLDEGHIVGNHTLSHKRATKLTAEELIAEVEGLEKLYYDSFPDADPMIYYRPPYGNCNEYTQRVLDKMGYISVMWSYTYVDYETDNQPSYADAMAKVKSGLHPGAVYLFHTESTTNAAILGDFIDWVRAEGYEILPICDITFEE